MKNLRHTLVLILALTASFAFAQERPYLLVDDNGDQYDILLKIDNADEVSSVKILGHYMVDGERNLLNVNIDTEKVDEFGNKMALVHELAKCCDAASYTVLVTNKNGEVSGYPEVNIDLSALAMNEVAQDVEGF